MNRYLATIRNLLRTARDEWQWIDVMPKIRLRSREKERDRWLTQDEADRLIAAEHLRLLRLASSADVARTSLVCHGPEKTKG